MTGAAVTKTAGCVSVMTDGTGTPVIYLTAQENQTAPIKVSNN